MYDESEAIGLEKYTQRLKRRGETVREVIEDKRLAHIDGAPQGRYYDRLIQREDGTWVGLEVKSGDSSYAAASGPPIAWCRPTIPPESRWMTGEPSKSQRFMYRKLRSNEIFFL